MPARLSVDAIVQRVVAAPHQPHLVWAPGLSGWCPWSEVAAIRAGFDAREPDALWGGLAPHITARLAADAAPDRVAFTLRAPVHGIDLRAEHGWRILHNVDTEAIVHSGAVKGLLLHHGRLLATIDGPALLATGQNSLLLRAIEPGDDRPLAVALRAMAGPVAPAPDPALPADLRVMACAREDDPDRALVLARTERHSITDAGELFELVRVVVHLLGERQLARQIVASVAEDDALQQRAGLTHPVARSAWLALAHGLLLDTAEAAQSALQVPSSTAVAMAPAGALLDHLCARALLDTDARSLERALTRVQVGLSGSPRPTVAAALAQAWALFADDRTRARQVLERDTDGPSGWTATAAAWVHALDEAHVAINRVAAWSRRAESAAELVILSRIHRSVLDAPDAAAACIAQARDRATTTDEWRAVAEEAHEQADDAPFFATMLQWQSASEGLAAQVEVARAWHELTGDIDEVESILDEAAQRLRQSDPGPARDGALQLLAEAYAVLANDDATATRLRAERARPPAPAPAPPAHDFPGGVELKVVQTRDNTRVKAIAARRGPDSEDSLAVGTSNHDALHIRLSDLSTLARHGRHTDWVRGLAMSDDGRLVASGCDDGIVVLWDLQEGRREATEVHGDYVRDIAFQRGGQGPGQRFVTVGDDGRVSLRQQDRELWRFDHEDGTRAVDFTADNRWIWVAVADFGNNLMALDADTGTRVATLEGHPDWINALRVSPDGRWMATGGDDNAIRIWDLDQRTLRHTLRAHGDDINDVAWHPDSRMLAATADDGRLSLWDAHTGRLLGILESTPNADGEAVAFVDTGTTLLWADDSLGLRRVQWTATDAVELPACAGCQARTHDLSTCDKHPEQGTLCLHCMVRHKGSRHCARCDATPDSEVRWCDEEGCPDTDKVCEDCLTLHKQHAHGAPVTGAPQVVDAPSPPPGEGLSLQVRHTRAYDSVLAISTATSPEVTRVAVGTNDRTVVLLDPLTLATTGEHSHHDDWVRAVAVSPDGRLVASGCDQGAIVLWDTLDNEQMKLPGCHSDYIRAAVFDPSGSGFKQAVATGGDDEQVVLRNRHEVLWKAKIGDQVHALDWSPDGTRIWAGLGAFEQNLVGIDPTTGELGPHVSAHGDWVRAVRVSPDGRFVASGCDAGDVKVWRIQNDQLEHVHTLKAHTGHVKALAWHPSTPTLVSVAEDGRINAWDTRTGALLGMLQFSGEVHAVAFVADGRELLAAGNGEEGEHTAIQVHRIALYAGDAPTTTRCAACNALSPAVRTCPDHAHLGAMCAACFETHEGEQHCATCDVVPDEAPAWCDVSGCPDTLKLCAACLDKHKRTAHPQLFKTGTLQGPQLSTLLHRDYDRGLSIALSPGRGSFALSTRQHTVEHCDLSTLSRRNHHRQHTDWVRALAMSPDHRLIASGCDEGHIVVWDTDDDEELVLRRAHTDYVRAVAFTHHDSGYRQAFVSGGDDNRIVLRRRDEIEWDIKVAGQGRAMVFTHDDRHIWAGLGTFDDNLLLLEAATGRVLATLPGHSDWINVVALSPDGRRLATGSDDNAIKVWDTTTHALLHTLEGHADDVNDASWHPDSRTLAAAGEDGRLSVWDTDTGALLAKRDFGGDAQAVAFIEEGAVLLAVGDPMGVLCLKWT